MFNNLLWLSRLKYERSKEREQAKPTLFIVGFFEKNLIIFKPV